MHSEGHNHWPGENLSNTKLEGQILFGGEVYGRAFVEAEIRDYALLSNQQAPITIVNNNNTGSVWAGPGHPAGYYIHEKTGNKFYSSGEAFCWYGGTAPGNPTTIKTSIAPTSRNDGQCPWDTPTSGGGGLAAGHYSHNATGHKFYYNGNDALCWFLGEPPAGNTLQTTNISTDYVLSKRNDGRCPWDQ
jgi:hypothetical protein